MNRCRQPAPGRVFLVAAILAAALSPGAAQGEAAATGLVVKSYQGAASDPVQHLYALLVPRKYAPEHPWPLLVALHGAFSNHTENLQRVLGGMDLKSPARDPPMLVLSPLGGGELLGYDGLGEDDVLGAIAAVRRDYNIDPDRIYLTGLSMGGGGTWSIGLRYPDLFAALVPVCAVVDPRQWIDAADRPLYDLPAMELAMPPAIAENALDQRVFIYHGDADPVVPVSDARRMVQRFRALGWLNKSVRYFELPGVAHNAWDVAYRADNIFHLLDGIRRDPFPARVWFKTGSLRYQKAYWTRIDRIHGGPGLAEIDARQHNGAFTVRVTNISGFSLLLPAAALAPAKPITVRVHDGADNSSGSGSLVYSGPAGTGSLSFARDNARWRHVDAAASGAPPAHAFVGLASRSLPRQATHVYIYGTDGPAASTEAARHLAEALANWGPGVRAHFPVLADRELSDEMVARENLVLIGDASINRITRRLGSGAPLPIAPDAAQGDRSYRLIAHNALGTDRPALIFGAHSPTALGRFFRFARSNKEAWAPEPNLDYIQFNAAGAVEKTQY